MTKVVVLSSGAKVHFRTLFSHKMHREQVRALNEGVFWELNPDTGNYEKKVPAENMDAQYEAVLPLVIEKIEQGGKDVECTTEWLDGLPQDDYFKLEVALLEIKNGPMTQDGSGEKKA